jgi:hypothetical protein
VTGEAVEVEVLAAREMPRLPGGRFALGPYGVALLGCLAVFFVVIEVAGLGRFADGLLVAVPLFPVLYQLGRLVQHRRGVVYWRPQLVSANTVRPGAWMASVLSGGDQLTSVAAVEPYRRVTIHCRDGSEISVQPAGDVAVARLFGPGFSPSPPALLWHQVLELMGHLPQLRPDAAQAEPAGGDRG